MQHEIPLISPLLLVTAVAIEPESCRLGGVLVLGPDKAIGFLLYQIRYLTLIKISQSHNVYQASVARSITVSLLLGLLDFGDGSSGA